MRDLIIADGTTWRIVVVDAREDYTWAYRSLPWTTRKHSPFVLHHTALSNRAVTAADQLEHLQQLTDTCPYGLPYNFVVFPHGNRRVWYINDVDFFWPHTYDFNGRPAICAAGNFEIEEPTQVLLNRLAQLCGALRSMWQQPDIPVVSHRDLGNTLCPGRYLHERVGQLQP